MKRTGEEPGARALMIALTSGAVRLPDGSEPSFREGEVFAADHPVVKAAPLFFLGGWSTSEEVHAARVERGLGGGVV